MEGICTGCPRGCLLENPGCGKGFAMAAGEAKAASHDGGYSHQGAEIDFDTKLYKKLRRCSNMLEARISCGARPKELFYDLSQAEKESLMRTVSKMLSTF